MLEEGCPAVAVAGVGAALFNVELRSLTVELGFGDVAAVFKPCRVGAALAEQWSDELRHSPLIVPSVRAGLLQQVAGMTPLHRSLCHPGISVLDVRGAVNTAPGRPFAA